MKELEKPAIEQLIFVYTRFLEDGLSQDIINKAKEIYDELIPANTLLSPTVNYAVGKLFSISYPNTDTNRKIPTKEEVKEILEKLKKRLRDLKNVKP